ncbi:MAG: NB-ARC domain-containing protein [Cyclobacteriaceae bacterium]
MNSDFKRVATSLGSIVLVTGAACAAATMASGAIMTGVVGGMLTGLATNLVDRGEYGRLKKLLIKTKPSELNHDLEKLLSEAVIWTLRNIGELYKNEIRHNQWDYQVDKTIEKLKEEVEAADKQGLLKHHAVVQQIDEVDSEKSLVDALTDQLPTIFPHRSFPKFFKVKFVPNLQLCFGELLKDPKNRAALIAYQRNVMNCIQKNTQKMLQQQSDLKKEFKDLRGEVERALQKLDEKVQSQKVTQTDLLTTELEKHLQSLPDDIRLLVDRNGKILQEVKVTQQKVDENREAIEKGTREILEAVKDANASSIKKILGKPPYFTDVFLGRESDLEAIHQKLFKGNNLLLLVNGRGGIGKTTVAAQYYLAYRDEYAHLAWVFAKQSIAEALLTLSIPLKVGFEPTQTNEERLDTLLNQMRQLKEPCLLVVDNANRLADLEKYYPKLRSCPNFHVLLTTRITEFEQAVQHRIEPLSNEEAIDLFTRYYPRHQSSEDDLLKEILTAVGKNTLVIELLAQNLQNQNRLKTNYHLSDLLQDLQQKGLLGIKSKKVKTTYQAEKDRFREETPEDIIGAMYDLGELTEAEQQMMGMMAVLPAENIPFDTLDQLLPEVEKLDTTLLGLAQKGWLEFNEVQSSFKISPVVQEVVRNKNDQLLAICQPLITGLIEKLDYEPGVGHLINATYEEGTIYTRYTEHIVSVLPAVNYSISFLFDRIGSFYRATGNLINSLKYYEQYRALIEELYEAYPQNVSFKNGLAISYVKLGLTYEQREEADQSKEFFQKAKQLWSELVNKAPQYAEFQRNLNWVKQKLEEE